jgi:hypothetical protein
MDIHTAEPLVAEPSLVEVEIAIGELKSYKSPGTDQIRAELIKAEGETLYPEIYRLTCSILNKEELSHQWKESTRVIYTVRGLTILLPVGTLWRCGDGLFFEVPPLESDTLLTTLHPFLENVLQTVISSKFLALELPFHGWKSPEIACGEIWTVADVLIGRSTFYKPNTEFNSDLATCDF